MSSQTISVRYIPLYNVHSGEWAEEAKKAIWMLWMRNGICCADTFVFYHWKRLWIISDANVCQDQQSNQRKAFVVLPFIHIICCHGHGRASCAAKETCSFQSNFSYFICILQSPFTLYQRANIYSSIYVYECNHDPPQSKYFIWHPSWCVSFDIHCTLCKQSERWTTMSTARRQRDTKGRRGWRAERGGLPLEDAASFINKYLWKCSRHPMKLGVVQWHDKG